MRQINAANITTKSTNIVFAYFSPLLRSLLLNCELVLKFKHVTIAVNVGRIRTNVLQYVDTVPSTIYLHKSRKVFLTRISVSGVLFNDVCVRHFENSLKNLSKLKRHSINHSNILQCVSN